MMPESIPDKINELQAFIKQNNIDNFERKKAFALIMLYQGYEDQLIVKILNLKEPIHWISKWKASYEVNGIEGLRDRQLKLSLKDFSTKKIKPEGDDFFIDYSEKQQIYFASHTKAKLMSDTEGVTEPSQGEIIFSVDRPLLREDIEEFYCFGFEVKYTDTLEKTKTILEEIRKTLKDAESYLKIAYYIFENNATQQSNKRLSIEGYEDPISDKPFRLMGILRLANIYDPHKDSVNLAKFLDSFSSNFSKWSIKLPDTIPQESIKEDIRAINEKRENEILKKLFNQRDKEIAHCDLNYLLKHKYSKEDIFPFANKKELCDLIKYAKELCDKYKEIFDFNS
ncbi:hypothetical protein H6G20_13630 [Desertifilum sp. FACHB-1129]|uniref:HEPN AbiU2-like domain-containing protein n=2 Tax=Desertifilum tharense IPPAS B-1220 TaxID=1781255 RepID=A0A1E5QPB1_9CYAN|nr:MULTISPECIES: hypothetical protein [Desertifilum]MDA0211040.1 hypothetical protein [Cyanobacteria bacterium FC1]MBD2312706.1 hypothetical protein [Desertifilum sp. FACHB-1129]MBD2320187.1 hypothetical protein [Desertifilum sp. FACHB-866]MBD2330315.1 hypothetical protein [Desertifilum sp. FACHB-868]OEJ76500.1 hypothetical protein BH720_03910 [Desertifilum tharense IPPAS B-1220]